MLGWVFLLVLFEELHSDQHSFECSILSTTQRGEKAITTAAITIQSKYRHTIEDNYHIKEYSMIM
jgi:capsule polysaccharide export protein KpsE/RkpR